MGICNKLSRHLYMLTYIYLNVDECWLTSSMHHESFKLQISLNYGSIKQNVVSWSVLMLKVALTWSWSILVYWHFRSTNNDTSPAHHLAAIKTIVQQLCEYVLLANIDYSSFIDLWLKSSRHNIEVEDPLHKGVLTAN